MRLGFLLFQCVRVATHLFSQLAMFIGRRLWEAAPAFSNSFFKFGLSRPALAFFVDASSWATVFNFQEMKKRSGVSCARTPIHRLCLAMLSESGTSMCHVASGSVTQ